VDFVLHHGGIKRISDALAIPLITLWQSRRVVLADEPLATRAAGVREAEACVHLCPRKRVSGGRVRKLVVTNNGGGCWACTSVAHHSPTVIKCMLRAWRGVGWVGVLLFDFNNDDDVLCLSSKFRFFTSAAVLYSNSKVFFP